MSATVLWQENAFMVLLTVVSGRKQCTLIIVVKWKFRTTWLLSLAGPAIAEGWLMFCFCFFYVLFNDSCQASHLQIYWTDLQQIFRVGRSMAVAISLKLVFRPIKESGHGNRFLLVLYRHNWVQVTFVRWRWHTERVVVHGCRWTQAACGAAGRANVGFCSASSFFSSTLGRRSFLHPTDSPPAVASLHH